MRYGRAGLAVQVDDLAEELLRDAVTAIRSCTTPEEASTVLLDVVARAGGDAVPARVDDERLLPTDLTLGTGEPLLVDVEPTSMARLRLEQLLPILVELWDLHPTAGVAAVAQERGGGAGTGIDDDVRARFLAQLSAGQRSQAIAGVLALQAAGVAPRDLASDLIAGAQREIGWRWLAGLWSVGQEHRATSISRAALSALSSLVAPASSGRAPEEHALVLACAVGEWHTMPAETLGNMLSWEGWDVTFLGPSLPSEQLATYLAAHRPMAVGLSCSLADRLPGALASIEVAQRFGIPVLAGGGGFGSDGLRALRLGATAWADDLDGALGVLDRWRDGVEAAAAAPAVDRSAFDLLAVRTEMLAATAEVLDGEAHAEPERTVVQELLAEVLDHLVSAQLVGDPRVLRDYVLWARGATGSGVGVALLRAGIEAMADISAHAHPAAGELLADAALLVDPVA